MYAFGVEMQARNAKLKGWNSTGQLEVANSRFKRASRKGAKKKIEPEPFLLNLEASNTPNPNGKWGSAIFTTLVMPL